MKILELPVRLLLTPLFCLGTLFTLECPAPPSVENIRHRLISTNLEMIETGLRDVIAGHGAGSKELFPDIQTAASRLDLVLRDKSLAPLVIEAIRKLGEVHPFERNLAWLGLFGRTATFSNLAYQEFFKDPKSLAEIAVYVTQRSENPQDLVHLMKVTQRLPPKGVSLFLSWIQTALKSSNGNAIFAAAGTICAQIEKGASKEDFRPLRKELLTVLGDKRWLPNPANPTRYTDGLSSLSAVADAAVLVFGQDPELLSSLQRIYSVVRRIDLSGPENQEWVNRINLARGRPTNPIDWQNDARKNLDENYDVLRTGQPGPRTADPDPRYVAALLSQLDPGEVEEYLEKLFAVPGQENFKEALAKDLSQAPEDWLRAATAKNPICNAILTRSAGEH